MCKAVVVVDLPENCKAEDCIIEIKVKHDNMVMSKYETNLTPLPEKRVLPKMYEDNYELRAEIRGYNDCIDLITGERDWRNE